MKTTQEFKVGDIVRFKLEDKHQEYATRWDFPTFGLKISKIERVIDTIDDRLLIYFEGRENFWATAVFNHRLEKQPTSMFAFGKKNPKIKKLFWITSRVMVLLGFVCILKRSLTRLMNS